MTRRKQSRGAGGWFLRLATFVAVAAIGALLVASLPSTTSTVRADHANTCGKVGFPDANKVDSQGNPQAGTISGPWGSASWSDDTMTVDVSDGWAVDICVKVGGGSDSGIDGEGVHVHPDVDSSTSDLTFPHAISHASWRNATPPPDDPGCVEIWAKWDKHANDWSFATTPVELPYGEGPPPTPGYFGTQFEWRVYDTVGDDCPPPPPDCPDGDSWGPATGGFNEDCDPPAVTFEKDCESVTVTIYSGHTNRTWHVHTGNVDEPLHSVTLNGIPDPLTDGPTQLTVAEGDQVYVEWWMGSTGTWQNVAHPAMDSDIGGGPWKVTIPDCPKPKVRLDKSNDTDGVVEAGESFNWIIGVTVQNAPATSTISDTIPSAFDIQGVSTSDSSINCLVGGFGGQTVTCTLDKTPVGSHSITVEVEAPSGEKERHCKEFTNTARIKHGDGKGKKATDKVTVDCPEPPEECETPPGWGPASGGFDEANCVPPTVSILTDCDNTVVTIDANDTRRTWRVLVDGNEVWSGFLDWGESSGELTLPVNPGDTIEVQWFREAPNEGWVNVDHPDVANPVGPWVDTAPSALECDDTPPPEECPDGFRGTPPDCEQIPGPGNGDPQFPETPETPETPEQVDPVTEVVEQEVLGTSAEITKVLTSADPASVGETVTFQVTVVFTGDERVSLGLQDVFEHDYLEYVGSSADCTVTAGTPSANLSTITCDLGTVQLGSPGNPSTATFTETFTFTAIQSTLPGRTVNQAFASANGDVIGPAEADVEIVDVLGIELPDAGDGSVLGAGDGRGVTTIVVLLTGLLAGAVGISAGVRRFAYRVRLDE